jgi:hypothetical protein
MSYRKKGTRRNKKTRATQRNKKTRGTQRNKKTGGNSEPKSIVKRTPIKPNKLQLSQYKNIETFFKNSIICGDSGECLNFGINRRFDFLLFSSLKENKDLISSVEKINEGSNGLVYRIDFLKIFEEKNKDVNIIFSTILKTSLEDTAHNLAYEYIAGKYFINEQTEYYPNFLLTYEIFKNKEVKNKTEKDYANNGYDTEEYIEIERENIVNSFQSLSDESITEIIKQSCKNPMSIAILTQFFDECETLDEFFDKKIGVSMMRSIYRIDKSEPLLENKDKIKEIHRFWVPIILYQIYFVLSELSKVFTHYDLHASNVLVYKLPVGKYIKMNYINNEGKIVTSFKTIYIPKIIDYGTCYFYKTQTMNSKFLFDTIVCTKDECNKRELKEACGYKSGYHMFEYDRGTNTPYDYLPSCSFKNESKDLNLAYIIKQFYQEINKTPETVVLKQLLEDVFYESKNGETKEILKDDGIHIFNVNMMRKNLEARILHTIEFKDDLDNHFDTVLGSYTCLGTLNIYEKRSRKMEFIPDCD